MSPFLFLAHTNPTPPLDTDTTVHTTTYTSPPLQAREALIEGIVLASVQALETLVDRLGRMGLGDAVAKWIDGDADSSFYEFKIDPTEATREAFKAIEVVANKTYHASGIITKSIFYNYTLYVMVEDGSRENPLLDSSFPDVSGKGRGYQIFNYSDAATHKAAANDARSPPAGTGTGASEGDSLTGHPLWPELKKVSIWQTTAALEQEFRERAALIAQKASDQGEGIDEISGAGAGAGAGAGTGPAPFQFGAGTRLSEASAAQSTHGASEMPLPRLENEESSLASVATFSSEGSLLPSGTAATLPLHTEGKDWRQNTVESSIADVGTGTILGSLSEYPQPKLYNEDGGTTLPMYNGGSRANNGGTALRGPGDSDSQRSGGGGSVASTSGASGSSASGASGASASLGSSTYASNITPGGSWRSMGSIRGGSTRGGLGGRGLSGHGIVIGTAGSGRGSGSSCNVAQRDVQGNELIGSNYQHSEGFDLQDFSRHRQGEFVSDMRAVCLCVLHCLSAPSGLFQHTNPSPPTSHPHSPLPTLLLGAGHNFAERGGHEVYPSQQPLPRQPHQVLRQRLQQGYRHRGSRRQPRERPRQ